MISINPKHKGFLHKALGLGEDAPIPAKRLASAKNSPDPHMRKMATFAENARHWSHGGKKKSQPKY